MPNWCLNELTISGDRETIDNLLEFVNGEEQDEDQKIDFNKIIPYPENLKEMDEDFPAYDDPDRESKLEVYKAKWGTDQDAYNFGGYDWCCENWGTKWNACYVSILDDGRGNSVCFGFDTAWSPPIPVVEKLASMYPTLEFELKYEEGGCGFAGDVFYSEGTLCHHNEYDFYQGEQDEDGEYEELEVFESYRRFHN